MRDRPPHTVNRSADLLELAEPLERRLGDTLRALQRGALCGEHLVDRGLDVLGTQRLELRQPARREQRIAVHLDAWSEMRGAAVGSVVHVVTLTRATARRLM